MQQSITGDIQTTPAASSEKCLVRTVNIYPEKKMGFGDLFHSG